MRIKVARLLLWIAAAGPWGAAADAQGAKSADALSLSLNPQRVCATGRSASYPNVDLVIGNSSAHERQIDEIHALVRDSRGVLVERRMLWQQGLNVLGADRALPPRSKTTIFNPFTFSSSVAGQTLTYELLVVGEHGAAVVSTTPQSCANRYSLALPVAGRVLVYDGFDYFSHHRRGTYDDNWSKGMGITDNFQRFGIDLVIIDPSGRYFTGEGTRTDQWLGWGKPVRAAAEGIVAASHDGQPDNVVIGTVDKWTDRPSSKNPMSSYGNYVLIQHAPGEFTLAGHLRNGSVLVRKGQRVAQGQEIGAVGNSGASGGVHVHFERRTGWGLAEIQTLPAYFDGVTIIGDAHHNRAIAVNTGDVVIAR